MAAVNTLIELHLSTSAHLRTSTAILLVPHVDNPTTSSANLTEPQNVRTKLKNSKNSNTIKTPQTILGTKLAYREVSKLAASEKEKYVVLAKRILKPATTTPKTKPVDETKSIDLTFIEGAPFTYLAKQKNVEICAISMRDIEYQLKKAVKTPMDPKTVVPENYHKFLNVFSKETSDTLSEHSKYDYRIQFLEDYKNYSNSLLQAMSEQKLQFVKKFLEENLKKEFIKASSAPCLSLIMLAVKLGRGVRFCVDYKRLNKYTVKDAYPIPLIKETLAQLRNAKVFMKIDI